MSWIQMHIFTRSTVKFKYPGDIDLRPLVQLTEKSLEVLEPLCKANNQSLALKKITDEAHDYARAIHSSIGAAQFGYNVADDALTLSKSMKEKKQTKEELDQFAMDMLDAGKQAYAKTHETLNKFRNVRKDLTQLISEAKAKASDEHPLEDIERHAKPLEDGIPIFEELAKNISIYITWWNWMEMKTNAQVESAKVKYTAMRGEAAITKWTQLREAFVYYTEEISRVEDTYREMFKTLIEATDSPQSTKSSYDNPQVLPKRSSRLRGFLGQLRRIIPGLRIRSGPVI